MTMRSLLAAPLFRVSLREKDCKAAFGYIGLGAAFTRHDLELLEATFRGSLCTVEVPVKSFGGKPVKWKLLHCAGYFGHAEAIGALLDRRADIEVRTSFGYTPLHQAARNGHPDIVELLLGHAASIHATTAESRTALHSAAHQGHSAVAAVLLRHGGAVDAVDSQGRMPLHSASECGHIEVVELLLEHRAEASAQSAEGMAPLHYAARDNHVQVVSHLISRADSRSLVRMKTRRGISALDLAEAVGYDDVADMLRNHVNDELPDA